MKNELKKDLLETVNQYLYELPVEDDDFQKIYIGMVIDNKDPDRYGRCKVRVHGLHDEFFPEDLPWAIPEFPLNFTEKGSFMVPEIGTLVYVKFDDGDLYEPIYFGKVIDRMKLNYEADHTEDYPDSIIFYETKNGDYFKINRFKGEYTIKTGAGVFLKFNENGDIELTNTSSEQGNCNVRIKGDFNLDDRLGNFNLITQNHSTSAFSDVKLISNGSVSTECLDDISFQSNRDFSILTGESTSIQSRIEIIQESIKNNIRANTISILPSTSKLKTTNVNNESEDISQNFSLEIGNDMNKVPFMSVKPSIFGGGFCAQLFDPMTGVPLQGRIVTGLISPAGFAVDDAERITRITKAKSTIELNYAKISATYITTISRKYSSIDSQAQIIAAGLTGNSILLEQKQQELESGLLKIQNQKLLELEQVDIKYGNFIESPIYGTKSSGYELNRVEYEKQLLEKESVAILDITGKTTPKDIAGPGNGLFGE